MRKSLIAGGAGLLALSGVGVASATEVVPIVDNKPASTAVYIAQPKNPGWFSFQNSQKQTLHASFDGHITPEVELPCGYGAQVDRVWLDRSELPGSVTPPNTYFHDLGVMESFYFIQPTPCEVPPEPEPIVLVQDYFANLDCDNPSGIQGAVTTETTHTWDGTEWVPNEPTVIEDTRTEVTLSAEELAACEPEVEEPEIEEPAGEEPKAEPKQEKATNPYVRQLQLDNPDRVFSDEALHAEEFIELG